MSHPTLFFLFAFMAAAITSSLFQPKKAILFFQTQTHSAHLWSNTGEPQWKKQGKK